MTEQPGGTPEPGSTPEERLPATRPPSTPVPTDRFTAPPSAHRNDLTPERSARIVRQSASARWVGLIAVVIVSLFVIGYYFYELGLPGGLSKSRLETALEAEQVVAVQRGYNIYQANCAQCHGVNGEGGKGPILNDQVKLFAHLNPDYIHSMLQVGGRFACGNPNSIMPVWANTGTPPGPLNYKQIENVIAFIRAQNTRTYVVMDPGLFEPVVDPETGEEETFTGWVDPTWTPAPGATPFPACWSDQFKPAASAAASGAAASGAAASGAAASGAAASGAAASGAAASGAAPSGSPGASAAPSGAAPSGSPAPSGSTAPAPSGSAAPSSSLPTPSEATITESAQNIQFEVGALSAPADTPFQIVFDNKDAGQPHNIAIKDSGGTQVFMGAIITGVATTVYQVQALPAGSYPFVCSVHANMTGTLTVGN